MTSPPATTEGRADNHPWAVAARAVSLICLLAVTVASLGPTAWLPRLLYSNNLEHFAAFYVVTLFFYTGRYRTPLRRVALDVVVFATALEAARLVVPGPRPANFQHWIADLGGVMAAMAPALVERFRAGFRPAPPRKTP